MRACRQESVMRRTDEDGEGDWSALSLPMSTAQSVRISSHRGVQRFQIRSVALAGFLVVAGCGSMPQATSPLTGSEWHQFAGTWTAAGARHSIQLGANRQASTAQLTGSLLLAGPSKPAVGFRSEAIVFNDSSTGMVGRAVWTDEHGDQVFSELKGEGTASNNRIVGTFVGGTGRYSGATGTYEFSWRFLLEDEDGTVQGQSIGLSGQVRAASPQGASDAGGPH